MHIPPTKPRARHPVAFAAWIGFFVTAINLLPVGQLDGGHVLYALAGRRQEGISRAVVLVMAPLGFLWWGWFLWGGVLLLMGLRHPPVLAENFAITPDDRMMPLLPAFWLAGLSTLLAVGAELSLDEEDRLARALRDGALDTINEAGQRIVQRQLEVPPTLTIRPGFPVRVIVTRVLVLAPSGG